MILEGLISRATNRVRLLCKTFGLVSVFLTTILVSLSGGAWSADRSVSIGYLSTYTPWIVAIAEGTFEDKTDYEINWVEFDSGLRAVAALARGDVQIVYSGVTPIAGSVSSGVDLRIFWIIADISRSEALVVRKGSKIVAPQDLRGKRIATPVGSTTHYHLLFALEQFQIPKDQVEILHLPPREILKAWEEGSIDAAFIWEPALGDLLKRGTVLVHSGQLGEWGRPTFDALAVEPKWAKANKKFMRNFVKVIAETDNSYRRNPGEWDRASGPIDEMVAFVGGTHARAVRSLKAYDYPSMREQMSPKWLGPGEDGGAATALRANAEFLQDQGILKEVLPDYSQFIDIEWVRRARRTGLGAN